MKAHCTAYQALVAGQQVSAGWYSPIEIDCIEHISRNDEAREHQNFPQHVRRTLVRLAKFRDLSIIL